MTAAAHSRNAAGKALIQAISTAAEAWEKLAMDYDDVAAWIAHERAQNLVREARGVYTRATVDARLAAQKGKR